MHSISLWLLLIALSSILVHGSFVRNSHKKRCRTTDDLGRIPYFAPNSTFHNLGFPLIRSLCNTSKQIGSSFERLGCGNMTSLKYLYESEQDLRYGNRSSTIIVDPHLMEGLEVASSGSYVIMAMFEILFDLGYRSAVRHWSEGMNNMFPPHVAAAAVNISRQYEAFINGTAPNPYASTPNVVMFQIEAPFAFRPSVPVNPSPYHRTFQWMIGLHHSHNHFMYQNSDPASHCTGANFFLGGGHLCTTSEVISCPQYDFHRTRSLEVTSETRRGMKKNIILFDDDHNEFDTHRLRGEITKYGGLDDLEMYVNKGRKRSEMPDLYKQVKMTIDCRNPGVEFINYESTLYDVMTLSCDMRATRNVFDFPVPSKYHINPSNWTHLALLIHDSMINYEKRIDEFKHFKRLSRTSNELAKVQVDIHFFSRDVMFRTYCGSYAECRRVYPWAVAVWTLYPMAMIEVVADIDLQQELLDSDRIRLLLPEIFNSKFFKMFRPVPGVAPVDLYPRTPCAYMVYMDLSLIPFGRDFLNTHVAALVKDPRPIVYWQEDKLAIAVMHARPYLKLFRDGTKPQMTYIEDNFTVYELTNSNVSNVLSNLLGPTETVDGAYVSKLRMGKDFSQERLDELLRTNQKVPTKPCEDSNSHVSPGASTVTPTSTLRRRTTSTTSNDRDQALARYLANSLKNTTRVTPAAVSSLSILTPTHGTTHPRPHPHHLRHQHERSYGAIRPRCVPHEHLIIDALYVPYPIADHSVEGGADHSSEPSLWLTSSLPLVPFKAVFDTFTKAHIEAIVQHLDPILQNSYMRKIISLIPTEISDAFKVFDAIDYPNVISLRDMEYPHWGEKCT